MSIVHIYKAAILSPLWGFRFQVSGVSRHRRFGCYCQLILDTRCWILDARCSILDTGYSILDTRCSIMQFGMFRFVCPSSSIQYRASSIEYPETRSQSPMARKIPIGLQHLWHDTYQEIISISMRNLDFFTDIDIKGFRVQGFKGSGFRGSRVLRFSPARRECGK